MKRVLVTRPEPGASATALLLRDMGLEPVVLPLSRIVPLRVPPSLPVCDAVAVTSANAIRNAPESLIRAYVDKPCFAVGIKTAAAARGAGFTDVREGDGKAGDLAEIIANTGVEAVAYLAGRVRLPDFEDAMRTAGIQVETIEIYDTEPVEPSHQDIESLREGRPIDAVLIYSAKAAEAMQRLAKLPALSESFSHTVHCCLSRRIAERLEGTVHGQIRVAERPEEAAILALLTH